MEQQSKNIAHFRKHSGLKQSLPRLLQNHQLRLFSETKHVLPTQPQPVQLFLPRHRNPGHSHTYNTLTRGDLRVLQRAHPKGIF